MPRALDGTPFRPGNLATMTSPTSPTSATHRTSMPRVVASAVGAAVVTWLLWHFAFGDSVGRSTIQAFVILAVVLAGIAYGLRSDRPRR